jgi:hypothetical protein
MYSLLAAKFTMPRSPKGADHLSLFLSNFPLHPVLVFARRIEHPLGRAATLSWRMNLRLIAVVVTALGGG